jgi:putative transposase
VFIRIRGVLHDLWRAVDQHGIVQKPLLQGLQYEPKRLVTDGLRSVARR